MIEFRDEMITTGEPASDPETELDLALAAEVQAALLPTIRPPAYPNFRIAALNRMCGSVGGDFYDFIPINDEQVALVVGDVVGHGVRASLLMARIMGTLRSSGRMRGRPRQMIDTINRLLLDLGDRTGSVMPCSLIYGVLDAPSATGFFINAGHPMPLLCGAGHCDTLHLGPRNILLGVETFEPKEACHAFASGERLIFYTDGVTDAANPRGDRFEEDRLREAIQDSADGSPEQCARVIFQAVEDFRQSARQTDDETVVVIDRI